jgi:hypothetical protein
MFRLLADTCVWLDLAKTVNGEPLIAACRQRRNSCQRW